ncbi:TetR/AcrR family transcriptional regulator [Hyphobacterium sp.]|uniref:TetR/AcrR family transcriptional regulator n=1 Tax=Hyphobacterium sp. TaxID=2004662 RepID=UPI003BAB542A
MRRTRHALLRAFSQLALSRPYEQIRVADIVEIADVGRSTFYEHFNGRDAIFVEALKGPLQLLADTVREESDTGNLQHLMQHYWDYRALARNTFSGPMRSRVMSLLTEMIATELPDTLPRAPLVARQIAEAHAGLIRAWVGGDLSASVAEITTQIRAANFALISATRTG